MRNISTRIALTCVALIPVTVNLFFISPVLWSHNSTAAFDTWFLLWVMSVAFAILTLRLAWRT